jgi:hypothetical protein
MSLTFCKEKEFLKIAYAIYVKIIPFPSLYLNNDLYTCCQCYRPIVKGNHYYLEGGCGILCSFCFCEIEKKLKKLETGNAEILLIIKKIFYGDIGGLILFYYSKIERERGLYNWKNVQQI